MRPTRNAADEMGGDEPDGIVTTITPRCAGVLVVCYDVGDRGSVYPTAGRPVAGQYIESFSPINISIGPAQEKRAPQRIQRAMRARVVPIGCPRPSRRT